MAIALYYTKHTAAEALLQKGANVEGNSYDTKEPLLVTIENGDLKGFELLLKHNPVLKFGFLRATLDILVNNSIRMKLDDPQKIDIILDMAKILIKAGVNIKVHVRGNDIIDAPALAGHLSYGPGGIDLTKDNGPSSVLYEAICIQNIDLIKLLLDNGYDVHNGYTAPSINGYPLTVAAHQKNKDLINLLLEYGADINAFYSNPLFKDPATPLVAAIRTQDPDMDTVLLLIKNGAIVHRCLFKEFPKSIKGIPVPIQNKINPLQNAADAPNAAKPQCSNA